MKDCLFTLYDESMAGIVSTLEPRNDIGALRIQVNDLSLAFITPLCSDNSDICHLSFSSLHLQLGNGDDVGQIAEFIEDILMHHRVRRQDHECLAVDLLTAQV